MHFQETPTYRGIMPHLYANYKNDFVEGFRFCTQSLTLAAIANNDKRNNDCVPHFSHQAVRFPKRSHRAARGSTICHLHRCILLL